MESWNEGGNIGRQRNVNGQGQDIVQELSFST